MATGKRGRPRYEPAAGDGAKVKAMAGMGIAHDDIARVMGISTPTLRRAFRAELGTGKIEANAKIAGALFRMATDPKKPNVAAAIFWAKTQMGWVEPKGPRRIDDPLPDPMPSTPLGKKAAAQVAARTAQDGTDWDDLLPRHPPLQ